MKILDHGFVDMRSQTNMPGNMVVDAARCAYGSSSDELGEKDQKLIRFLLGNGHTSPFRHSFFTFHIKAPLFVFRQWWKYQVGSTWRESEVMGGPASLPRSPIVTHFDIMPDTDKGCSWNELSGRYKVMDPEFYVPEMVRKNTGKQAANEDFDKKTNRHLRELHFHKHNVSALHTYNHLLESGVAKELARLVLPPTIYSECYWTVSLQAVLHFLDQRLATDAQWEIRQYAQGVLELIKPELELMGVKA